MQNKEVYDELVSKFEQKYGKKPDIVAYAPGRIEVLGNHTDYNEGYVFSAAIDKGTFFAVSASEDTSCELTAGDLMETAKFDISNVAPAKEMTWQNYVTGTFNWLFDGAPAKALKGWKGMFLGNIPLGAGLSSSAALEMCTVLALSKLYGVEKTKTEMAKIGQKAEHTFAGCPCGLLDQASSMYGEEGSLVQSDFRTNEFKTVSMGPSVAFMMVKSNAKHALVDGAYASRRQACEDAAKHFADVLRGKKVTHLRDVTMAEWVLYRGGLDETKAKRAVHPIGEDERVVQGAGLLAKGDLAAFGALMYDSHESSRNWFENSCEELDAIVDAAKAIPEVYGARLSGGGFGGSCCLLVDPSAADKIAAQITREYKAKFGDEPICSLIKPSKGAHLV
ncbi:MAG: galactokinase [Kiritimatiellae bacterium]|nr:galactokinase [Kiritimatiellia bacterium]